MRLSLYLPLSLFSILILNSAGCGGSPEGPSTVDIDDVSSLVSALRGAGATVEVDGTVTQPFFGVPAQIVRVNGEDVQVFAYTDEASARADAEKVSADGSEIGSSIVAWVAPPHFFRSGKVLALYVGTNERVQGFLTSLLGPQFAGR